ncbi:hypothetical protein FSP39_003887 [Pinctada imbricata]|uniref:Reverse transcriptase domain-containing protein n=1 Tax=Pinctada imbricata TaxID=66713 RepID=A0AA88YJS2_PINIB|nr:hypothetical protein FSP39_003887 [Pinctada imbricata]
MLQAARTYTSNIMKHADTFNIMYPLQHGFRQRRSCETQLIEFIDDITVNLSEGKQTDTLIIDFSKAFDKVSHSLLLHKLDHYGIRGKTNDWIRSFLSERTQSVVVNGESSPSVDVQSGVPQGSVLGPCLFVFYINDMPAGINSTVRLFVDDTIAYLTISSDADHQTLQEDLNKLAKWKETWKMAFHPDKCQVFTISRKNTTSLYQYTLHGHVLEHVTSAKYLGLNITSDLRWGEHIFNVCNKANRTIGFLRRNLNISSTSVKENAYKTLVRPIVEYASSAWDPFTHKDKHRLGKVQRRAARYVKNNQRNISSVSNIINTLQWKSLEERRREGRLCMMYKITNNLVDVNKEGRLKQPIRRSRNTHDRSYMVPSCSSDYRKESFFPRTIREWNSLPPGIVLARTLGAFKSQVSKA